MAKKITIELSDDLYGSIQTFSKDINETINQILETFVTERKKRKNDPIFSEIVEHGSRVSDVSEEHDKYLYGN